MGISIHIVQRYNFALYFIVKTWRCGPRTFRHTMPGMPNVAQTILALITF